MLSASRWNPRLDAAPTPTGIAQGSNYTPVEAAKHVGETATTTGTVDGAHQSGKGNIFLNMGAHACKVVINRFRLGRHDFLCVRIVAESQVIFSA
jgi:hypothetical protein